MATIRRIALPEAGGAGQGHTEPTAFEVDRYGEHARGPGADPENDPLVSRIILQSGIDGPEFWVMVQNWLWCAVPCTPFMVFYDPPDEKAEGA